MHSPNHLTVLLVSLAGGALGGVVAALLLTPAADTSVARSPEPVTPVTRPAEEATWSAALQELEERVRELEVRSIGAMRTPVTDPLTDSDLERLHSTTLEWLEEQSQGLGISPDLDRAAEEAVRSVEEGREMVAALQGDGPATGTLDQRVARIRRYLDLDTLQTSLVRGLLVERAARQVERLRLWSEGMAAGGLEDLQERDEVEFRDSLERVLQPGQLERLRAAFPTEEPR